MVLLVCIYVVASMVVRVHICKSNSNSYSSRNSRVVIVLLLLFLLLYQVLVVPGIVRLAGSEHLSLSRDFPPTSAGLQCQVRCNQKVDGANHWPRLAKTMAFLPNHRDCVSNIVKNHRLLIQLRGSMRLLKTHQMLFQELI